MTSKPPRTEKTSLSERARKYFRSDGDYSEPDDILRGAKLVLDFMVHDLRENEPTATYDISTFEAALETLPDSFDLEAKANEGTT